jgi:tetratricopeptide (TPR) repeat protein
MRYVLLICLIYFSCKQKSETKYTNVEATIKESSYCTPQVDDKAWYSSGKKAPIFKGLEGINFPVTTKSEEAQKYFNQGLMLSYAFNHAEAARSFYEAGRQDTSCAMAWWGYALVLGPNYNGGMEPDNFQRAYDAVQKARSLYQNSSEKEKALIDALTYRYSNDTSISRQVLDSAYASAMRKIYNNYSNDPDIASLFAESLMDLHPWNLWKKDGTIQPWTTEIISVLEKTINENKKHAGANHFYIHAQEMSKHPEKSMYSADLLRDLVPGAGHLVHMPSHTYIRTGRYHDAVITNQNAVMIDSQYVEACHAQGAYPLAYYPHNYHFIAACGTLAGESKTAIKGAIATSDHSHKKLLRDPAWATLQHYYAIPWYVQVKLGLWSDILKSTAPEKDLKYPNVIWRYAVGMAMLSQNKTASARGQLDEIKNIMKDSSIKELTIWGINSVYDLCIIAAHTLEGEINAKEKNYDKAVSFLKAAIDKEDALNYDEPPDWFFSVRHNYGAVLINDGKYKKAIKIYEEDLQTFPENGWALKGMMNAYEKLGDRVNFNKTQKRFNAAWKHADMTILSSRIL